MGERNKRLGDKRAARQSLWNAATQEVRENAHETGNRRNISASQKAADRYQKTGRAKSLRRSTERQRLAREHRLAAPLNQNLRKRNARARNCRTGINTGG